MTNEQSRLYVGVADFEQPTLLVLGKPDSLLWLSKQISARRAFALEREAGKSYASLQFLPTAGDGHLTRQGNAFEWQLSALESKQVAQQIKELAVSDCPAHAYLDPVFNEAEVQVIVSINEYDVSRIFG
jgi:hypothetical protein